MDSVGVIEKALSFLYVQGSCKICVVRRGVRFRLGRLWGISRTSHLLFLWGLRCDDGAGWCAISKFGLFFLYLVNYRVDDIDMLRGRIDYLCERLCCMVVVASDF